MLVMRAIFRICGNESQPDLQLVIKLTTPLLSVKEALNVRISIGPLQLGNHVVQSCHAGEERGKQKAYII